MVPTPMADENSLLGKHFLHHPDFQVVIRRSCGDTFVPAKSIERHLRKLHKTITIGTRKALIQHSREVQPIDSKGANSPAINSGPIEDLSVLNGRMCNDCSYARQSEGNNMREHCRVSHKWKG